MTLPFLRARSLAEGKRSSAPVSVDMPGPNASGEVRNRWRFSIRTVLAAAVILLALLSVATLLFVLVGSRDTTARLITDRHRLTLDNIADKIISHLEPIREQVEFLDIRITSGEIDAADRKRLTDVMLGALAAAPQALAVSWASPDRKLLSVLRLVGGGTAVAEFALSDVAQLERRFARAATRHEGFWDEIAISPDGQEALLNYVKPVWRDNQLQGVLVSVVSVVEFSRFLTDMTPLDDAGVEFVLYGHNEILAHPSLLRGFSPDLDGRRLMLVGDVPDRVLAGIWRDRANLRRSSFVFDRGEGHLTRTDGRLWAFIYRTIDDYGPVPLIVGRYFPASEISDEFRNLVMAGIGGLVAVVLGVLMAWWVGRSIGRPVRQLAIAARNMREFDFDPPQLKRSWLVELDDANRAFNSAAAALKWFGQYVPRRLVTRLISEGESALTATKYRDVTVMFTDLVGFTRLSEEMPAETVASLLNEHFAAVAECIEDEDGVIDKFIGDAVMACWGAIKRADDHAVRACRTALAIAAVVKADNARKQDSGEIPMRMRIGIHSGKVVVGNIGAPGRINYTIVGDTVNTAQRLEVMGKEFLADDEDVVILVSGDALKGTGLESRATFVGNMEIRGRRQPEEIFRLK